MDDNRAKTKSYNILVFYHIATRTTILIYEISGSQNITVKKFFISQFLA